MFRCVVMLVGNRVRQARMQDSQKRGSYLGKSGPKPKRGSLIWET